jgi:acetyl-CoA acetyltransferase
MKEVAIIGAGIHPFGRFEKQSYVELGQHAAQMALQEDVSPGNFRRENPEADGSNRNSDLRY